MRTLSAARRLLPANRLSTAAPRRILVMALGDVGDVLLATPALRRLRDAYPTARITVMTKPSTIPVLANSGLVDAFLPVDKHLFDRPSSLLHPAVTLGLLRFVGRMRAERFDTVVLLHHLVTPWGTVKFALLALATGARVRAGLDNGRGRFLTHRVRDRGFDAAHESEYWLEVVDALPSPPHPGAALRGPHGVGRGLSVCGPTARRYASDWTVGLRADSPAGPASPVRGRGGCITPIFPVTADGQARADALLRQSGIDPSAGLLAIHPGSGVYSRARRWYPERFAAVADTLAGRHGLQVVMLGGSDERELAASVIARMERSAVNLAGRTDLEELAGVLRRCRLLVGNDAGVAHVASAVGTPVVAVFGPTNHHAWHPLGRSLVVRAEPAMPCMPCIYRGYSRGYPEGCPPRYCMQKVTPVAVIAAAEQLLSEA